MERLEVNKLIIGENLLSVCLAQFLKKTGEDVLILSPNKSAMLTPVFFKYNKRNPSIYQGNKSEEIQNFLKDSNFDFDEDFNPIELLSITGDSISCTAVYNSLNYYEYYKKTKSRPVFIDIENFHNNPETSIIEDINAKKIKIRVLNKDRMYSINEYASILDNDNDAVKDLSLTLKPHIRETNSILILPPVLGISSHQNIRKILSDSTGCKVFENTTFNQSVISKRLYIKMQEISDRMGVGRIYEKVNGFEFLNNNIKKVITTNYEIKPQTVILITQRFVEEGLIIRDNQVLEGIFNIPIYLQGSKNDISYFTEEELTANHKIFTCGIRIDNIFRPFDRFSKPIFQNLFSFGSIISGRDDMLLEILRIPEFLSAIKMVNSYE